MRERERKKMSAPMKICLNNFSVKLRFLTNKHIFHRAKYLCNGKSSFVRQQTTSNNAVDATASSEGVEHDTEHENAVTPQTKESQEEFRMFKIEGVHQTEEKPIRKQRKRQTPPPRYLSMRTDQKWTDAWPAASTFKWSVVPLPVRQGYVSGICENDGLPPGKYANAELMKIPNFLHLTPNHIKLHCAALKEFCTPWPEGLNSDEKVEELFPIEVTSSDYCHAGPSLRDIRARTIEVKLKLSSLELDYHARDKFRRLAGSHYDQKTDVLTFTVDRCPMKKQNYDFAMYLLTALYFESWKTEAWEALKTEEDMEMYVWENSKQQKNIVELVQRMKATQVQLSQSPEGVSGVLKDMPKYLEELPASPQPKNIDSLDSVQQHRDAVVDLHNKGESPETVNSYRQSVLKLLNLSG